MTHVALSFPFKNVKQIIHMQIKDDICKYKDSQ